VPKVITTAAVVVTVTATTLGVVHMELASRVPFSATFSVFVGHFSIPALMFYKNALSNQGPARERSIYC
jgi:hypothetical protein